MPGGSRADETNASAEGPGVPFLSIVTATFNSAATVRTTLESVRRQSFRSFEHIVVDGGSTDGTIDILREYGGSVRWISEPDRGIYDAMNKGIAMSRGRWIHLLNSDDHYAADDVLARIVPRLRGDAINYCDIIRSNPDGSRISQRFSFRRWPLYFSAFLPHPALIVSAAQYKELGLYDANFRVAADHDMILRLVRRYPANHIPLEMTVMCQTGISATNLGISMREFGEVLHKHEVPRALIGMIMAVRHIWWKARSL
ncbi:glycosyltransferase [Bradyrhizobium sp. WBOS7]|uniref:Glycosyltransferase n=2 Tax=Nitrobacteraceae TaxID=41294 RepID=A0AAE9NJP7_9BRAD|nr:glycosyltransferase [Bradyrhizobium sp. WBOS2]MDD1569364.1 glycosyltransferase [Bradyrhizobium sp. WBOS1]MDD1576483.1 glycosyltransferase [Bradyrhizobium sp. WBOS7]MDD1602324.1 glycosyltransferase [Bradyrhizobium sp. WBOS16]UUO39246.1 glycosyltransferase [Bradyrhizobium sp. WBOS01]UUO45417.1 glycosyltransferase [Bradyrhizobium sp. WBOS02]UUO57458.1 glycosyltransferase [Bradyrhizobium sp. WBOS07]UUO69878.1 glycosyltransferase [Bradyrhizobium betae]